MIPSSKFSFYFEDKEFSGIFVGHCPTVGDLALINDNEAVESAGLKKDSINYSLVKIISCLNVVIDKSPNWWKPKEFFDTIIIFKVYKKYLNSLNDFKKNLNIKEIAKEQINTTEFWFRKKYQLSPKDPRYLNCEPWEMELEFELDALAEDLIKKQIDSRLNLCSVCNTQLKGNICPNCGEEVPKTREYYFDPDFEEYANLLEKDNKEFFENQKWEEVKDSELDKMLEEEKNVEDSNF